jgi:hypothetical protein
VIDATTWTALGLTLTLLGLVASAFVWRRRGAASGLRGVAWALLPLAAALTGVLRLLAEIAGDIGAWALRLVFSPVVWAGVCLAGLAVVLYVVSGLLGRGTAKREPARAVTERRGGPARDDGLDDGLDDDLGDIQAILRKHGIS